MPGRDHRKVGGGWFGRWVPGRDHRKVGGVWFGQWVLGRDHRKVGEARQARVVPCPRAQV